MINIRLYDENKSKYIIYNIRMLFPFKSSKKIN